MGCKFKYGDRVKLGNKAGKITSISNEISGYICKVEFDDVFSVPPEKHVHESELELIGEKRKDNVRKCTCGTEATFGKVAIENHAYYCDLKIPEEKVQKVDNEEYLLEQFGLMLGMDDDDFGFFD